MEEKEINKKQDDIYKIPLKLDPNLNITKLLKNGALYSITIGSTTYTITNLALEQISIENKNTAKWTGLIGSACGFFLGCVKSAFNQGTEYVDKKQAIILEQIINNQIETQNRVNTLELENKNLKLKLEKKEEKEEKNNNKVEIIKDELKSFNKKIINNELLNKDLNNEVEIIKTELKNIITKYNEFIVIYLNSNLIKKNLDKNLREINYNFKQEITYLTDEIYELEKSLKNSIEKNNNELLFYIKSNEKYNNEKNNNEIEIIINEITIKFNNIEELIHLQNSKNLNNIKNLKIEIKNELIERMNKNQKEYSEEQQKNNQANKNAILKQLNSINKRINLFNEQNNENNNNFEKNIKNLYENQNNIIIKIEPLQKEYQEIHINLKNKDIEENRKKELNKLNNFLEKYKNVKEYIFENFSDKLSLKHFFTTIRRYYIKNKLVVTESLLDTINKFKSILISLTKEKFKKEISIDNTSILETIKTIHREFPSICTDSNKNLDSDDLEDLDKKYILYFIIKFFELEQDIDKSKEI
jgi:hypothetical protein